MHPVEVAEYAWAHGTDNQPTFAWWVLYTLHKCDIIISAIKSYIRKATHKYGIKVPKSVNHAYEFDMSYGDTFWKNATAKEMHNVQIAFEVLPADTPTPVGSGWSKVIGHIIFDVKMSLERKARWVLDGHRTPDPECSTYASGVSRESVCIALTYAALNDNAYLQAPSSQKHFIICGCEFGLENVGRKALIRHAFYGGKTSGHDFCNHLHKCMKHMGSTSLLGHLVSHNMSKRLCRMLRRIWRTNLVDHFLQRQILH